MLYPRLLLLLLSAALPTTAQAQCQLTFASPTLKPHFWLEDNKPKGLAVDYFREIEKHSGCRFKFQVKPWKRVLHEVELGNIDTSIGYYNRERSTFAHFPRRYFQRQSFHLYSRQDEKQVYNLAGMLEAGKPVLYLEHWYLGNLNKILAEHSALALPTPNPATGLKQLLQGRADALLAPRVNTLFDVSQLKLQGKVKVNSMPQAIFYQYAFFSKKSVSDELFAKLDLAIEHIDQSGVGERITDRYIK